MTTSTPAELRASLGGIRALVLDADGVLQLRGQALPGAVAAVAALRTRRIPFRVATNISAVHRETLAARFARIGLDIPPEQIVTALSATADHVRRAHPGAPVFVITRPDGLREFGDHPLLSAAEADADGAAAAAVVIGDGERDLSFENMDRAFRLVRRGAALVAMHRNPWWYTPNGVTIDSGAFVAALEYATGVRAILTGKPGPLMFRAAVAGLAADVAAAGGRRLTRREVAMVGDDPGADLGGARRAGLRGVLVLTGKTAVAEVGALRAAGRVGAVAATVEDVVAALD
ncbi:MAG: HAD-IIA family hydrolase [Chloroflexi bacterium]|nr:HAD-IIA family hydrolase [Chloroflexota bacterium]